MKLLYLHKKKSVFFLIFIVVVMSWLFAIYQPFKQHKLWLEEDKKLSKFIALYQPVAKEPWEKLKPKQLLQAGVTDKSVVLLRKRLNFTGDLGDSHVNNPTFDKHLEKAVSLFQQRHGLVSNGTVDQPTLAALNISPQRRLEQLKANILRWREFEKNQRARYLWINVPAFQAQLVELNKVTLKDSIIVGKPSHPTPEMFTEITEVMLNPFWIVPPGLAKRNIIPKTLKDTSYLERQHIRLFDASSRKELSLNELDSAQLERNPSNYFFRQEPGPLNPLGQVKYKITNSKAIFLHDTNTKELFKNQNRALSSGCIRLQHPFKLLYKIIESEPSNIKTKVDLKRILATGETVTIKLKKPVPVFITYMTAWVDEKGYLNFRDDIYNQDVV